MLGKIWSIAANTFLESVRQPIFVVVLLGTVLLLALNPAICGYAFEDDNKLLVDLGLSTMFLAGLLLSAFTATGVFSREIENHTVLTVISKPVGRPAFVIGKYLGVAAALLVAYWFWSLAFLLTVRHGVPSSAADHFDWPVILIGCGALAAGLGIAVFANYFYRRVFASTLTAALVPALSIAWLVVLNINDHWETQPMGTDVNAQLLVAMFLLAQALLTICAVAVAASTRLGQVMTLLICAGLFLLGLSSDYLFGRFADDYFLARAAYALVANLGVHWQTDALSQQHDITAKYVGMVSAYTALYVTAALAAAVALFQTREVS